MENNYIDNKYNEKFDKYINNINKKMYIYLKLQNVVDIVK
jgi:hypothetical protein